MAHRAGTVAIIGRPNVGKSTLLNALVGSKVAIVSPKPQTTRNRLLGIRTLPEAQAVFVDTPGIHQARSLLNRRMVDVAQQALGDADAAVLVIDAEAGLGAGDRALITSLAASGRPTVVVLNKLDRVRPPALLPMMAELGRTLPGRDVIPASAQSGDNVPAVLASVIAMLPEGPRLYPEDEYTTETERFLAQELVREQLFRQIGQEVPYGTTVVVDAFHDAPERDVVLIQATILVDREGHKGIVIGTGGSRLREVGMQARLELETLLGRKVFLELFVRTEPGWARNPRRLAELGL
jgi:GTP-binding protein Era